MFEGENLVNKLVTAAIVGLLGWNVMTTQQLSIDVAVIANKVDAIVSQSVTQTDMAIIQSRVNSLEKWNQNLSNEVRVLEETISEHINEEARKAK